jgi:hypothetical protein
MLEEMEEELNDLEVDWLIDDYELFAGDKRRETEKGEARVCVELVRRENNWERLILAVRI